MNIVLVGFMGTGKTAVGKRLAKRLGWRFVDVDRLIEARTKMSIARIFTERSEAVFRQLERRTIGRVLYDDHQVIATGGGAFVDPKIRTKLCFSGPVVCLTATPRTILARVSRKLSVRPLLQGNADPLARIRTLLQQRAGAYAQADLTIDTSELSVNQVVNQLWERLSHSVCRSWQYLLAHSGTLTRRYAGQYVVVANDRIVGSAATQFEAYRKTSRRLTEQPDAGIYYIPLPQELLTVL